MDIPPNKNYLKNNYFIDMMERMFGVFTFELGNKFKFTILEKPQGHTNSLLTTKFGMQVFL